LFIDADVDEEFAGTDALADFNGEWFREWESSFANEKLSLALGLDGFLLSL
jgi:hypothetical protein